MCSPLRPSVKAGFVVLLSLLLPELPGTFPAAAQESPGRSNSDERQPSLGNDESRADLREEMQRLRNELKELRGKLDEISRKLDQRTGPSEFTPLTIRLETIEGEPAAGFNVLLRLQDAERPVVVSGTSSETGLALKRKLPYGEYSMSIEQPDHGWKTVVRNIMVEFDTDQQMTVVTPDPEARATLAIQNNFDPSGLKGLKFGERREPSSGRSYSVPYSPEPDIDPEDYRAREFQSFPSLNDGISTAGVLISIDIKKTIEQPDGETVTWHWAARNTEVLPELLLTGEEIVSVSAIDHRHSEPGKSRKYFRPDDSPGREEYEVGYYLLAPIEITSAPVTLDVAAGTLEIEPEKFLGKAGPEVIKALDISERWNRNIWLEAKVESDSPWIDRVLNQKDWRGPDHFGRLGQMTRRLSRDDRITIQIGRTDDSAKRGSRRSSPGAPSRAE